MTFPASCQHILCWQEDTRLNCYKFPTVVFRTLFFQAAAVRQKMSRTSLLVRLRPFLAACQKDPLVQREHLGVQHIHHVGAGFQLF